ncbi:MAG: hypothetical protein HQ561_13885 [Desulfobacteraceae bacterium]|nr:hypothetical protein [Desulfobacteraceae bacterium]
MRKVLTSSVIVLMVFFLSAGIGLAGNGKGGGNGAGNGTGPIHDIFAGTPFTYTGDVASLVSGQGLLLALSDGTNVTIYGIGPVRYWESSGVDRPTVGDTVKADGYAVDYNGEVRNIAMSITVGTDTVQLRDPVTGMPLWRGKGPR